MFIEFLKCISLIFFGISIIPLILFIRYVNTPFLIIDQNGKVNDQDIKNIRTKVNPEFHKDYDVYIPFIINRIKEGLKYEPNDLYLRTILIYNVTVNVIYIKYTKSIKTE